MNKKGSQKATVRLYSLIFTIVIITCFVFAKIIGDQLLKFL